MTARDQAEYVAHFQARVIEDALAEATTSYWLRRADAFERAIHQSGDFPGLCSVQQIEANNARLAAKALACRQRAAVSLLQDDDTAAAIAAAIREAA